MQTQPGKASQSGPAADVLDREAALSRMDGDGEILCSLVEIYFSEIGGMMDAVREAIKTGDPKQLEKAAHRLKGSVSIFGAGAATGTAFTLEITGRSGDLAAAAENLAQLEKQIDELKPALESFRRDLQTPK
jgi:HPt (histidine-containing phosphotransfer) domain-containing protein